MFPTLIDALFLTVGFKVERATALRQQRMLILYYYQRLNLFSRFLGGQRESTTRYLYFKNNVDAKIHPHVFSIILYFFKISNSFSLQII